MSPPKKSSENKDYCKRYREKNRATYRKNDTERKRAQREKVKLPNPELYELYKIEERERKQLFRLRNKLGPVNRYSATSESPAAVNNNATNTTTSTSFLTKQARAQNQPSGKSVTQEPKKENRNNWFFGKEVSTSHRNEQEMGT